MGIKLPDIKCQTIQTFLHFCCSNEQHLNVTYADLTVASVIGEQQHFTSSFYCGPSMSGQSPASFNSTGNRRNELRNVCNNHMNAAGRWLTCCLVLQLLSVVIRRSHHVFLQCVIFHDKKPKTLLRMRCLHFSRCTEPEWRVNYNAGVQSKHRYAAFKKSCNDMKWLQVLLYLHVRNIFPRGFVTAETKAIY